MCAWTWAPSVLLVFPEAVEIYGAPKIPTPGLGGARTCVSPLEWLVLIFSPKGVEPEVEGRETPLKNCLGNGNNLKLSYFKHNAIIKVTG